MLFEFSSSLLVKNYISIQNLLNNARIIKNWHKNVSHYHFYFNRNKQIAISVITSKSFTFIEITCTDYIFSVLIIFTSTFSVLFIYLNQKFNSVTNKLESWIDAWYNLQTNLKKLTIKEKFQLQKQDHCWSCKESNHQNSDKICFFHNYKQLNIIIASTHKFSDFKESKTEKT